MSDFIESVAPQPLFHSIKLLIITYLINALWHEILFKLAHSTVAVLEIFSALNNFKLIKATDVSFSMVVQSVYGLKEIGAHGCVGVCGYTCTH